MRRFAGLLSLLAVACALPEEGNPTPRCTLDEHCPAAMRCYRTFCIDDRDGDAGVTTVAVEEIDANAQGAQDESDAGTDADGDPEPTPRDAALVGDASAPAAIPTSPRVEVPAAQPEDRASETRAPEESKPAQAPSPPAPGPAAHREGTKAPPPPPSPPQRERAPAGRGRPPPHAR